MATARVFKSGNSQAVRLPKEFRFQSQEVEIFRHGEDIVLREKRPSLSALLKELPAWPEDFPEDVPDLAPQKRRGL